MVGNRVSRKVPVASSRRITESKKVPKASMMQYKIGKSRAMKLFSYFTLLFFWRISRA